MPSVTAKRQCPDLIFVKPRFEVYKAISRQIREIFAEHTTIIEPPSLDEAYQVVTENLQGIPFAGDIALRIREKIARSACTGLPVEKGRPRKLRLEQVPMLLDKQLLPTMTVHYVSFRTS